MKRFCNKTDFNGRDPAGSVTNQTNEKGKIINNTMRLISGTIRSTTTEKLPTLSYILS